MLPQVQLSLLLHQHGMHLPVQVSKLLLLLLIALPLVVLAAKEQLPLLCQIFLLLRCLAAPTLQLSHDLLQFHLLTGNLLLPDLLSLQLPVPLPCQLLPLLLLPGLPPLLLRMLPDLLPSLLQLLLLSGLMPLHLTLPGSKVGLEESGSIYELK